MHLLGRKKPELKKVFLSCAIEEDWVLNHRKAQMFSPFWRNWSVNQSKLEISGKLWRTEKPIHPCTNLSSSNNKKPQIFEYTFSWFLFLNCEKEKSQIDKNDNLEVSNKQFCSNAID